MIKSIPYTIGITSFRDNIASYLKKINEEGKPALILAKNKPLGIVIPIADFDKIDNIVQQKGKHVNNISSKIDQKSLLGQKNEKLEIPKDHLLPEDDGIYLL